MNTQLIPVFSGELSGAPTQLVDARLLHTFLESAQDFSDWVKKRIKSYGFVENQDYLLHKFMEQLPSGAKAKIDYHLSLDMAKELSMVERNEKGKQARRYFIDCERRLLQPHQTPSLDAPDYLKQSREALLDFVAVCEDTVKATGGKVQKWPELSRLVVDGLIAERLRTTRMLVSFDLDMTMRLTDVPNDSCVVSGSNPTQLNTFLRECVPFDLVPVVLESATQRLIASHQASVSQQPAKTIAAPLAKTPSAITSLIDRFIQDWKNTDKSVINAPFIPCLGTQALRLFHVWAQNKGIAVRLGNNYVMSELYQSPGFYKSRVRVSTKAHPRTVLMIDGITSPSGMTATDWIADCIDKMEAALIWMEIP